MPASPAGHWAFLVSGGEIYVGGAGGIVSQPPSVEPVILSVDVGIQLRPAIWTEIEKPENETLTRLFVPTDVDPS